MLRLTAVIYVYACVYMYKRTYCNTSSEEEYARFCKDLFTEQFTRDLSVNKILSINVSKICTYATGLLWNQNAAVDCRPKTDKIELPMRW